MKEYIKIDDEGNKFYYSNEEMTILHREDGPAIEYANGTKEWFINGKLHRENGPAVECGNYGYMWFLNGKKHREDGPAIDWFGYKEYWINGKDYTEKKFNKKQKRIKI